MASTSWGEEYSKVVILGKSGSVVKGIYDGYGRAFTRDGMELELDDAEIMGGDVKLVADRFYEGEKYEDLLASKSDPGQGHFHDEEKIQKWYNAGGFASWKEYVDAYYDRVPDSSRKQGGIQSA